MIAGCPKCSARYRVAAEQIGADGAKLRCTKCSAVFMVRAPRAPAPPAVPAPVRETSVDSPSASAASASASPKPAVPPEPTVDYDPSRLVLVADPVESNGKQTADAIETWGLSAVLVHDGVEAMLAIQRMMPSVVVLDAALPKMFGFQVCEVVKRNESLRHIRVVLVGAIHHQDRYRRNPADLYGADVYLEQPDLPEGLMAVLREAGMAVSDPSPATSPSSRGLAMESTDTAPSPAPAHASPTPAPIATPRDEELVFEEPVSDAPAPPAEPGTSDELSFELPLEDVATESAPSAPTEASASEPVADEDPERAAERERAERLARIAVSEMLLYQPEKFDEAIRDGNVEAVLDMEIQEARALIRQRISEEVRAEKDFILVELERVAAERGGGS